MKLEEFVDDYLREAGRKPLPINDSFMETIRLTQQIINDRIKHTAETLAYIRDTKRHQGLEESWEADIYTLQKKGSSNRTLVITVNLKDDNTGHCIRRKDIHFPFYYLHTDEAIWLPKEEAEAAKQRRVLEKAQEKDMKKWEQQRKAQQEDLYYRLKKELGK